MARHNEHSSSDPEANAPDDSPSSLKGSSTGVEQAAVNSQADDVLADEKAVRRLVRKIDWRLLPCLALTYSFALIDRVNLPNARIAGMDEDLGLSIGDRYSIISMIFFVPYVVFQFPSNIVIRKIGTMWWLPSIVMAWGVVMIGMGFSKKWTDLLAMRVLLGIFEVRVFNFVGSIECELRSGIRRVFIPVVSFFSPAGTCASRSRNALAHSI